MDQKVVKLSVRRISSSRCSRGRREEFKQGVGGMDQKLVMLYSQWAELEDSRRLAAPCWTRFFTWSSLPKTPLLELSRFSSTSGKLPCVKICFPQYFGITRRYMQKKTFVFGKFYFFYEKKMIFRPFFAFYCQRSVTAAWATRSPWSIFCYCHKNSCTGATITFL